MPDDGSKEPKHVALLIVYVILILLLCQWKVHCFLQYIDQLDVTFCILYFSSKRNKEYKK